MNIELFREYLRYDPTSGQLIWTKSPAPSVRVGSEAGTLNSGYRQLTLKGKIYKCHKIAYLLITGQYPKRLGFADGDPNNLVFSNLQPLTKTKHFEFDARQYKPLAYFKLIEKQL